MTGANKGIGKETARQLAALGITVWIGARNEQRGEAAEADLCVDGADVRYVLLDVTNADTIESAVARIDAEHGHLDILVNNAVIVGASGWHPPDKTSVDDVRELYETNVFGVLAVTNAMLPLLHRAAGGRIVNVSSSLGSLQLAAGPPHASHDSQGAVIGYSSSKSALNMITLIYARALGGTPIKVNAVDPGYCATDLNGFQGFISAADGASVVVDAATLADDGPTGSFLGAELISW
ncbi:MAG: SDR family NAD(P)-dependent oxidoreductase [Ilumatobacteraceae bacterium]